MTNPHTPYIIHSINMDFIYGKTHSANHIFVNSLTIKVSSHLILACRGVGVGGCQENLVGTPSL